MNRPPKELFKHPEQYIPESMYCYTYINGKFVICPFWDIDIERESQNNGYCHYLKHGDWNEDSFGLLWDQCKECGINDNWEEFENV